MSNNSTHPSYNINAICYTVNPDTCSIVPHQTASSARAMTMYAPKSYVIEANKIDIWKLEDEFVEYLTKLKPEN